jgi:hypothetical protein
MHPLMQILLLVDFISLVVAAQHTWDTPKTVFKKSADGNRMQSEGTRLPTFTI